MKKKKDVLIIMAQKNRMEQQKWAGLLRGGGSLSLNNGAFFQKFHIHILVFRGHFNLLDGLEKVPKNLPLLLTNPIIRKASNHWNLRASPQCQ